MAPAVSRRIHGRNGRLYVGLASDTAVASPITYKNKWTISATTDKVDVTAFGDSNKVYVAGLADASGTVDGFYDTLGDDLYTAAQDGLARKFYLYPTTADATYWFGTAFFDFSADGGVTEAVTMSSSWVAASPVIRVNAA